MGRNVPETWEDERESRLEKGETCATAVACFNKRQVNKGTGK
jgi:hypothetical protein